MRAAERALVAVAAGCATAVIAYAAARVAERAFFPEPNPAMLIWADRSSFVWRAATALYAGGMGAFGGWAAAARAPAKSGRLLEVAFAIAIAALVAQGAFAP